MDDKNTVGLINLGSHLFITPLAMINLNNRYTFVSSLIFSVFCSLANADDIKVLAVDLNNTVNNYWVVKVTLQHNDTGWDHYADSWQVEDVKGNVLGYRLLLHPHVTEQPFTRSLANVKIPKDTTILFIKAHDKVHGWTNNSLQVDLDNATEGHLRVEAE